MNDTPLGLYVHWPYCARICPYCDFNVYKARGDDDALFAALLADLDYWQRHADGRKLVSVHFGGGTPSLLSGTQIAQLIARASDCFGFAPGAEIGLEANPNDAARFEDYAAAGINRLSLGVQSFRNEALTALGRDHDAAAARQAWDLARELFGSVSLDLIYAREGQGVADWEAEFGAVLSLQPDHLSTYQLTIEPGTAFERRVKRGELVPPEDDLAAQLYSTTQSMCEAAGLAGYEISNHARAGHESRHNRLYWEGGDWIGIGPGAHGRIGCSENGGRIASDTARRPADYVQRVAETGTGSRVETLSALDEARERILMGLRVAEGLDVAALEVATGLGPDEEEAGRFQRQGLLTLAGGRLSLTRGGRLYADGIAQALCP
ncbi:radical SAM family heme chaperone HemW [Hyphobacterium sp.]|jgi:oxygen-independent coproporphyrinogen-3 oxidase|uniref:radical SAM family heme chaperone HemW n=1 Tax=Hyphobacterium sp. TaxID=2004662 RepID=UPI003BAB03F1